MRRRQGDEQARRGPCRRSEVILTLTQHPYNPTPCPLRQGVLFSLDAPDSRGLLSNRYNVRDMTEHQPSPRPDFLTHLEGLRGLAILLILLFHICPEYCANGFLGVDVFLLISGYLLFKGLFRMGDEWSLCQFINKKILRLLPPLLPVLFLAGIASCFVLSPSDAYTSVRTALAALFMYANAHLHAANISYFGQDSAYNLFLHTWYLGVTAQAFLLFALVFTLLRKASPKVKGIAFALIGLLSFAFVCYQALGRFLHPEDSPLALYYLTSARLYEFTWGGACLLWTGFSRKRLADAAGLISLLLIVACAFYPGKNSQLIFPVLAATAVMVSTPGGITAKILNFTPIRWLGKRSYSVFLWHWPLIVLTKYYITTPGVGTYIALFIASCAVGALFFRLTEAPKTNHYVLAGGWTCTLAFLLLSLRTWGFMDIIRPTYKGISLRTARQYHYVTLDDFPDSICYWREGMNEFYLPSGLTGFELTQLGVNGKSPSFLMMGDSHAYAFRDGMDKVASELNLSGYYLPAYVTPFRNRMAAGLNIRFDGTAAADLMSWLKKHPEITHVVLVQYWRLRMKDHLDLPGLELRYDGSPVPKEGNYAAIETALQEFCLNLKMIGKEVILMEEVPSVNNTSLSEHSRALLTGRSYPKERREAAQSTYRLKMERLQNSFAKMEEEGLCHVIHAGENAFVNGVFRTYQNGELLMRDTSHVSPAGARFVAEKSLHEWRKAFDK